MTLDIGSIMGGAGTLAKDLRSAITGEISPEKKAELELKAAELDAEILRAQLAINQAEAASPSLFVSGWRPALGWTGALAFFVQFLIRPLAGAFGLDVPALDIGELWPMLAGILGLGTLRTVEKVQSVARK